MCKDISQYLFENSGSLCNEYLYQFRAIYSHSVIKIKLFTCYTKLFIKPSLRAKNVLISDGDDIIFIVS